MARVLSSTPFSGRWPPSQTPVLSLPADAYHVAHRADALPVMQELNAEDIPSAPRSGGEHASIRSSTPTRTGRAHIRLLRICLGERVLGAVEATESSTLADIRLSIAEDEVAGVPHNFVFVFGGAPVTRRQESRRRAMDCFPFLQVIPEGEHVASHPVVNVSLPPRSTAAVEVDGDIPSGGIDPASRDAVLPDLPEASGAFSERAGPVLELQITDGPLEGLTVTVDEVGAHIGRHTSNTLVIPEAGVSRFHCEIDYRDDQFCVRDLGSTTGTYFYLRPNENFRMFAGLMVKLGETEFQVLSQTVGEDVSPEQVVWFFEGPLVGSTVHVPAEGVSLGRRHVNSLVLVNDGTVSAHHASIFYREGDFFITDLGSSNGTCVRLSPDRTKSDWHPIIDGDVLGAGCTKVRCRVYRRDSD